jgi:hypothetical protein
MAFPQVKLCVHNNHYNPNIMVDYAQDDIFFITFGFNHEIQFTDMFGELTNDKN